MGIPIYDGGKIVRQIGADVKEFIPSTIFVEMRPFVPVEKRRWFREGIKAFEAVTGGGLILPACGHKGKLSQVFLHGEGRDACKVPSNARTILCLFHRVGCRW